MKQILVIGLLVAIIGGGCSKSYLSDLQNNPNAPTTAAATPQLVLPATITRLVNILNGVGPSASYEYQAAWLGEWNYSPGYSFNSTAAGYVMTSSSPQLWDPYFAVLTNLNFIEQQTVSDPKQANYYAISNVLTAICFQNLVDLYNNIPYSQALKAQANFYPTYDNGSDIYDSLVVKLDAAMTQIKANMGNATVITPTTDDVLFGGDMQQWLVFANTVKLRMLVRQSNTSKGLAALAATTASYGYLTTDALVNPGYSGAQPSPMYGSFGLTPSGALGGSFTYLKANSTAIDFYKSTQDPRLGYIYSANGAAPNTPDYNNVPYPIVPSNYGADPLGSQDQVPGGGSGIGSGVIQAPNQSAVMMLACESYFLQAEAKVLGILPGGPTAALPLYQQAITSSFEYLNVGGSISTADAAAQTYYNQDIGYVAFPTAAGPDTLEHTIITQKWAALNSISNAEAYNDWRRTFNQSLNNGNGSGYPIVPTSIWASNTQQHMPFRYLYPTEEANNNNDAWTKAGGPNTNPFTDKIFWMK